MKRSRVAANSWRSKSVISISIRMAPTRRSFGAASGCGRAGKGGVPMAGNCELAEGVARTLGDRGGTRVSAVDWKVEGRRTTKSGKHCADLQAGGTVDWNARASG